MSILDVSVFPPQGYNPYQHALVVCVEHLLSSRPADLLVLFDPFTLFPSDVRDAYFYQSGMFPSCKIARYCLLQTI